MSVKLANNRSTTKTTTESSVIANLRTARRADDTLTRLRARSMESQHAKLKSVVESTDWEHGPAELVATYQHHAVVKSRGGKLIRVEWSTNLSGPEHLQGNIVLRHAKVFDLPVPVADLGEEVFTTARAAALAILEDSDPNAVGDMLSNLREAMNVGGDLDRRLQTEMALRSINRNAWWHPVVEAVVGAHEGPAFVTVGDNVIRDSFDLVLKTIREGAESVSQSMKTLATRTITKVTEQAAQDIAADIRHAVGALLRVNRGDDHEMLKVCEAVGARAGQLLAGAAYLRHMSDQGQE